MPVLRNVMMVFLWGTRSALPLFVRAFSGRLFALATPLPPPPYLFLFYPERSSRVGQDMTPRLTPSRLQGFFLVASPGSVCRLKSLSSAGTVCSTERSLIQDFAGP